MLDRKILLDNLTFFVMQARDMVCVGLDSIESLIVTNRKLTQSYLL
jgi:hypothetical protein